MNDVGDDGEEDKGGDEDPGTIYVVFAQAIMPPPFVIVAPQTLFLELVVVFHMCTCDLSICV